LRPVETKPALVVPRPVGYHGAQDRIVPQPLRAAPGYQGYQATVTIARDASCLLRKVPFLNEDFQQFEIAARPGQSLREPTRTRWGTAQQAAGRTPGDISMSIPGDTVDPRTASPDSVTFDTSRYSYQGENNGGRIWFLPEGGGLGLYFFPRSPDLPSGLTSVAQLRRFYVAQMGSKLQVVECRVEALDGIRSVWLIGKGPDEQTGGAVYLGSLTIPFRDFGFVIKLQCQEQGVTGLREALLIDEALKNGTGSIEGDRFVAQGWSTDDEQFDHKVPQHPLSRLRRELRLVASSLRISPKLKGEAGFDLPQNEG